MLTIASFILKVGSFKATDEYLRQDGRLYRNIACMFWYLFVLIT